MGRYRMRRQLTPTSLFLGLLLGLAIPGSISAFRLLIRGRIAPAHVRRLSAGGFFGTTAARGDTQGHRGADRSRLVSKATTTSSISGISPSASASASASAVVGEATSASPVMAMAPQAVAQAAAQTRARPTASTRTQDDDEPQPVPEEPRAAQGPEAVGGQGEDRDKEEDDDQEGTSLTQQELDAIVGQRGVELSRLNGAASHLALAHSIWGQVLRPGGVAVDATCGNGHDSLVLAKYLFPSGLSPERTWGRLHCVDIQEGAVARTRHELLHNPTSPIACPEGGDASEEQCALVDQFVSFHVANFKDLPSEIAPESVNLLVYNLGYLPGSDKHLTTNTADTLTSLREALFHRPLLAVRGLVSIMCYRGHPEGAKETAAVLDFVEGLDPEVWRCFAHTPLNRPLSPLLITIYRIK